MSELRPSYRHGQSAQPLVHPAGKAWLPLAPAAMAGASLLIVFLVGLPPYSDPP